MKYLLNLVLLENGHLVAEKEKVATLPQAQLQFQGKVAEAFEKSPELALMIMGFQSTDSRFLPSFNFWLKFSQLWLEQLRRLPVLEDKREKITLIFPDQEVFELIEDAPFFTGSEYLNSEILKEWWQRLTGFFKKEIKGFKGSVEAFFKQFSDDIHLVGKIHFHLVENRKGSAAPFAFLATYSAGYNENDQLQHRPLQYAMTEYADDQEQLVELLTTVYSVAEESKMINELVDSGELFYPLSLTQNEAYTFLKEVAVYERLGVLCRVPNWWRTSSGKSRLQINVGEKKASLVGLNSLVDFNGSIILGDAVLTPEEAEALLKQSEGLAFIKGKWIPVDHDQLRSTLDQWEQARQLAESNGITLGHAMKLLMNGGGGGAGLIDGEEDAIEVAYGEWLDSLLEKVRRPQKSAIVKTPKEFKATLRPYQQHGLNWLAQHNSIGFGACLADDMGLGKTVQILAFLSMLRRKKESGTSLLVVPSSLIGNWRNEILKFAPKISFAIAHKSGGEHAISTTKKPKNLESFDLVITTYGMVKRADWLKEFDWQYAILDEAQAIKNPGSQQTKAIKSLNSHNRLILTGTPVENKLSDLWSLFDFINPGLLGNKSEFSRLVKEHKGNPGHIRKVISPFILRRLKTDKSIISDLPDKIEMETYAGLTRKQMVLYQDIVENLKVSLEKTGGIERKGLVLSSLMKFKQICNHPDQFLGNKEFDSKHSGKFERLREICETIASKREKVLIFTQFKEITTPLADFLEKIFGRPGFVLHGGTSIKKRNEMVKTFQSDEYVPFFVLSVKAGGTGLNLTSANHVVHFDRWWNPAVENQATDRAFRIGQQKNVLVHKFVTEGTVEEKISLMIAEKQQLSNEILSEDSSVSLTEMSNEELIEMFTLGG